MNQTLVNLTNSTTILFPNHSINLQDYIKFSKNYNNAAKCSKPVIDGLCMFSPLEAFMYLKKKIKPLFKSLFSPEPSMAK